MNCTELFVQQAKARPKAMALCIPQKETTTFEELLKSATRAQTLYSSYGVGVGDSVLLLDGLSTRLYSSIIALASLGATVILVEPWMPVAKIENAIRLCKPKLFVSNALGFLWGARIKAIRQIRHWVRASSIENSLASDTLRIENVDPNTPGILTFTSGTTGNPKGVVRNQGYLLKQHEVLSKHLESHRLSGPDLCIFANFVLSNLASGRGSVIIPPTWKPEVLKSLDSLPKDHQPESLTAGPAFLLQLMKHCNLPSLKSIHIGGALTDCWIFEKGFQLWPHAHWGHVYGGSEAEPVALADAHEAVAESRSRGFFQTLYLGKNVSEIRPRVDPSGLWVAGPHVCPEYLGNDGENQLFKKKDADGTLWHFMGDRIAEDTTGKWWYQGRSGQTVDDFELEQKIYQMLQSSKSFIRSNWLVGEGVFIRKSELLREFPTLKGVAEAKIFRDRRHRARIDRAKTVQEGAKWLAG